MKNPKSTSTRAQLAEWLKANLPETVTGIDHPNEVEDPPDYVTAIFVVIRESVTPGSVVGQYLEKHNLWILDPLIDRQESEDALDGSLAEVIGVLEAPGSEWLVWTEATRDTFLDKYPAYRIDVTIASNLID